MAITRRVALAAHGMMFALAIGTLFYSVAEGWSSVDALYFSAVSLTTVGYGDLRIQNTGSRLFAVFYILFGVTTTVFFLGTIAELFVSRRERLQLLLYDSQANRQLWQNNGTVTEAEYLEHMLIASGRIDSDTLNEVKQRYIQLHKSGVVARFEDAYTQSNDSVK